MPVLVINFHQDKIDIFFKQSSRHLSVLNSLSKLHLLQPRFLPPSLLFHHHYDFYANDYQRHRSMPPNFTFSPRVKSTSTTRIFLFKQNAAKEVHNPVFRNPICIFHRNCIINSNSVCSLASAPSLANPSAVESSRKRYANSKSDQVKHQRMKVKKKNSIVLYVWNGALWFRDWDGGCDGPHLEESFNAVIQHCRPKA